MKNRRVRWILAFLISLMPASIFRIFLYRAIFGYRIYRSHIGWGTILVVDDAELYECHISRQNSFTGPMRITIKKNASIGPKNTFNCSCWTLEDQYKSKNFDPCLHIGMNARISPKNHFDIVGSFVLGNNSHIAGRGSQFWTHGNNARYRNINIGEHCYIGSAVRFAPGSSVGDNCMVSLGSIVTKKLTTNNAVIAGQPAEIIVENYDWETKKNIR
jgi:acetyltransferase-like isoleucine patch superfamily enzyme